MIKNPIMLKIKVNESQEFDLRSETDGWYLDDARFDGDVADLGGDRYHVIWRDRSYNVELVEQDFAEKTITLKINGQTLTTSARNRFDLLLESMGMNQTANTKINEVKAPMPGLIQSIAVQPGDRVQKGDTLLVLVAMKMENAIKSPGEATIATIRVVPGATVEKNEVLIEFA